ncbi:hypothetical protein L596_007257 [Steinernema carpocapsae]|uniref:Uncharacterized protein n=1 Tax=Steinernema carpocapsae TaxID=34508 RepID=A0A4U5P9E8_STECR|nr:hypothetical protein L596_007257 [Steinernema carpocapsae]
MFAFDHFPSPLCKSLRGVLWRGLLPRADFTKTQDLRHSIEPQDLRENPQAIEPQSSRFEPQSQFLNPQDLRLNSQILNSSSDFRESSSPSILNPQAEFLKYRFHKRELMNFANLLILCFPVAPGTGVSAALRKVRDARLGPIN